VCVVKVRWEDKKRNEVEGKRVRGVKELSLGRDGGSITNWDGCRVSVTKSNRVGGVYWKFINNLPLDCYAVIIPTRFRR